MTSGSTSRSSSKSRPREVLVDTHAFLWFLFDEVGSISRPVKELKFYEKKLLNPGETAEFKFVINAEKQLSFPNSKNEKLLEDGYFTLMVGNLKTRFKLQR